MADHRSVGGLERRVRHHQRRQPPPRPVQLPGPPPQGAPVHCRGAHHVGCRLPHRRGPGRGAGSVHRRPLPRHRVRGGGQRTGPGDLHHPSRAARRLRRRRRPSRRRPLSGPVRPTRRHPAVSRPRADLRHRAGRPREGHRHPDGVHLRRHHRRAVVAGAGAPVAPDRRPRRPPAAGHLRQRRVGQRRPRRGQPLLRRAGRQEPAPGARRHRDPAP